MIEVFQNQQLLQNLHQTGWTIDVVELVNMFFEISEFTNRREVVRRMNKQELASMQGNDPTMNKIKGQIAVDNNRSKNQSDLNAEKNDARATEIVLREGLEQTLRPEVLTGAEQS